MFKHRVPFNMLFPTGDRELNLLEMENELAPYKVGEAIAQVKMSRVEDTTWIEVDELSDTSRGADGGLIREGK
jgi:dUTPase